MTVAADLERSARLFRAQVAPRILPWLGGGHIVAVEGNACEACAPLDTRAAIDYLHVDPERGVRGLATRAQWRHGDEETWPWNSFTLRLQRDSGALTEVAKLSRQEGWLMPALHVQAYFTADELDSVAIVPTVALMEYVAAHSSTRRTENAEFAVAFWKDLKYAGVRVASWQRPNVVEVGRCSAVIDSKTGACCGAPADGRSGSYEGQDYAYCREHGAM